jgi:hypothetical protein
MIHYVTGVTNWTYYPSNANAVGFSIIDSKGGRDDMHLFFEDNPQEAKDFYERNTSGNSVTIKDKKRINDLEKALERIAYGDIRVTDIGGIAKDALGADPDYGSISF